MDKPEHKDAVGHPLREGDYIAYAAQQGDTPSLKMGLIVHLAYRDEGEHHEKTFGTRHTPTLRIKSIEKTTMWDPATQTYSVKKWVVQGGGKIVTLGKLDKVILIPSSHIPAEVHTALHGT